MYTGELNLASDFNTADKPAPRGNSAIGNGGEASFALLFEAALEVSAIQENEPGSCSNGSGFGLDSDGLLGSQDSSAPGTMDFGSIMSRLLPRSAQAQLSGAIEARQNGLPGNSGITLGTGNAAMLTSTLSSTGGALDKNELSEWMDAHALTRSTHHCAMYCRMGLEAAGLNTADRPASGDAGDYGPFLLKHGAQIVPQESYVPQVGDVVIFSKTAQHPSGHIEMYDGHNWVSDFMQHSFSPYRDASSAPPFTIYRLG